MWRAGNALKESCGSVRELVNIYIFLHIFIFYKIRIFFNFMITF